MKLSYQQSRQKLAGYVASLVRPPLTLFWYVTEGFRHDVLVATVQDPAVPTRFYVLEIFEEFPGWDVGSGPENPGDWQVLAQNLQTWIERLNGLAAALKFPVPETTPPLDFLQSVRGAWITWEPELGSFSHLIEKIDHIEILAGPTSVVEMAKKWQRDAELTQRLDQLNATRNAILTAIKQLQEQLSQAQANLQAIEAQIAALQKE